MTASTVPDFRAASPASTLLQQLGPLGNLPGNWSGHGFNLIARPDFQGDNDIFLELNPTDERLRFSTIGGPIPNRGSEMDDIELFGLHYLQQISDRSTGGAIHLEPGVWLNVPATTTPAGPRTVVRLATIPHGNAVLAQGTPAQLTGPPVFNHANTVPFPVGGTEPGPGTANSFPEYDLGQPNQFRTTPTPAHVTQAVVTNPNSVLTDAIAGQTITATTALHVSTVTNPAKHTLGGTENIPFLQANADVSHFSATFWIETVQFPAPHSNRHFLQLQYTQTIFLNFLGLSWPHVNVATLKKVT
jgi:hypothetical protein